MAASLTSAVGATATAVIVPEKAPKSMANDSAVSELAGVPHTVYDEVDSAVYLGPRGVKLQLRNSAGLRLQTYLFPAENAKAVLIFVHGHGSHALFELEPVKEGGQPPVYGGWVQRFNEEGISVAMIDNQGSGRSEAARGLRFYVENFDDYVDDVLDLHDMLGTCGVPGMGGLPVFLSGISMGGCVAVRAALREPDRFQGLLLLAPMLSLDHVSRKGLNPYIRPLARLLSYLCPSAAIVATDRNTMYPELQAQWDADPLVSHMNTRVRNANEYLRVTEEVMARLEDVRLPFIVCHSENDTMCDCEGSKALYRRGSGDDKTIRLVNHMWHVLVKEEGNEQLQRELLDWLHARI